MLLVCLFTATFKGVGKSGARESGVFPSYGANVPLVAGGILQTRNSLDATYLGRSNGWIDTWVTRLFIGIVLISAAIFLISQCPGFQSPFWLGVVLQGFTYGSAALFYVSGGDESTGR